jgi:periplasmic copper chaperone A
VKYILVALALVVSPLVAHAQDTATTIDVSHAWARAMPAGAKTGAAYLTIKNSGKEGDRLVGVSSPVAGMAQLHTEINDNGVMKMRPLSGIDLKPGSTTVLKPGGMHIMLMDLKQPLKQGQSFPLTLDFAKSGKKEVQVSVAKPGAPGGEMGRMDMQGGASTGEMSGMKK